MSSLINIKINNFKGIKDASFQILGGKSPGRFITLIGLNEGGKTSILEAMSLSILQDPDTADLLEATNVATDLTDVVPKHFSAGFTGDFSVRVTIDFSEDDDVFNAIDILLKNNGYKLCNPVKRTFYIQKSYKFEDSNYKKHYTTWEFSPKVKKITGTKIYDLHDFNKPVWNECLIELKKALPRSIYFPTFLVDFPKRVYLEGDYGSLDIYYRKVIADALNSLENPLDIEKHIIQRVNKHRTGDESFSSLLRASPEGKQIDATVQALAAELNFVVFGAWGEIFNKPVTNRKIVIEWHVDESKNNHIYLEFYIIAGDYRFYISERSLGFRWFFSFLLFTQFQGSRADGRKIVFLFDEPASHLHPKAQERLLKSFEKIANPEHVIVYSTHSHYLINPLWLEQSYIISNSAIDVYDDVTGIDNISARVDVTSTPYKQFVSQNPSKTTYYQPVLDALDYGSSGLDISDPVIILEGKYDYYPFRYLLSHLGRQGEFRVMPAVGAGGLSALIGILRAWNVRFLLVLDDDQAGRKEKAKYKNDLFLSEDQVVTLDELDDALTGEEFEGLFQEDVRTCCINLGFSTNGKVGKADFYTYFQSLLAGLEPSQPMNDTIELFKVILSGIESRLSNQVQKVRT